MAIQIGQKGRPATTTATGDARDTGTPVSLAPTKPPRIRFADDFGGAGTLNYGRNRSMTPASIAPGTTIKSDLADDLRTTVGDSVLDAVQRFGTAAMRAPLVGDNVEDVRGIPATQLRPLTDKPAVPPAHGMRRRGGSDGSPG